MIGEEWLMILPAQAAELISDGNSFGNITCRISAPDRVAMVLAVSEQGGDFVRIVEEPEHFMTVTDWNPTGHWYHADTAVGIAAFLQIRQQQSITFEEFQQIVPQAIVPIRGAWYIAITYLTQGPPPGMEGAVPKWGAWAVSADEVSPIPLELDVGADHISALSRLWPTSSLQNSRVLLLGAGSIGGATATTLASYGVGHLDVVDPDRLLFHNVPRHVLTSREVGRSKVAALRDEIDRYWPNCNVTAHPIDLIERADIIRGLIDDADIIICTVDGVDARRVASALATRARTPIVFACVLDHGRYGEILRIRPHPEVGCLDCQRRHLIDTGQMDPEPSLDRGYGTGTRHNPMTAVGGDLHLIGMLAAKVSVATLLQPLGHTDQQLVNDNMVIALRPAPGHPEPFSARRALDLTYYSASEPYDDCPACHP